MNNLTIGQIQDLYDYLMYSVDKGYIDNDVVQDYIDNQDWEALKRIREFQELEYPEEFEWDVSSLMP